MTKLTPLGQARQHFADLLKALVDTQAITPDTAYRLEELASLREFQMRDLTKQEGAA